MPDCELLIELGHLGIDCHDLPDQDLQRRPGIRWQAILCQRLLSQLSQIGDTGVRYVAEFRKVC